MSIPPGHDAEIVGDETCVFIDFSGFETYAKEGSAPGEAHDAGVLA